MHVSLKKQAKDLLNSVFCEKHFFRTGKSEDLQSMGRGLPGLLNFEIFRLVNNFDVSLSASTLAFRNSVRRRHSQEQTVRGLGGGKADLHREIETFAHRNAFVFETRGSPKQTEDRDRTRT